jgi:hypothetical protein
MDDAKLFSKRNVLKFSFESALIVGSIFFALFLDEYRGQLEQDRLRDRALATVSNEIKRNLELVEEGIPNHQSILEKLDKALRDESYKVQLLTNNISLSLSNLIMPDGVSSSGWVDDSAWLALRFSSAFSNLDFDTVLVLSKVYNSQESGIEGTLEDVLTLLSSRELLEKENIDITLTLLRNIFHELVAQEEDILLRYKNALSEIEAITL